MNPKRIGFLGFEGVAASNVTDAADVFAAAVLDGGYGSRISCYQVCTIGFSHECFRAESGIALRPDSTLETVAELDRIIASVGFSDAQKFRSAFERRFGAKPRRYLKNLTTTPIMASDGKTASASIGKCLAHERR